MPSAHRIPWLFGALEVLGHSFGNRLFSNAALWWFGLAAGVLVAYLGLTLESLTPHLVVLTFSVALLSLSAPVWAWRWALLVSLPKPLFVEAGGTGRSFTIALTPTTPSCLPSSSR